MSKRDTVSAIGLTHRVFLVKVKTVEIHDDGYHGRHVELRPEALALPLGAHTMTAATFQNVTRAHANVKNVAMFVLFQMSIARCTRIHQIRTIHPNKFKSAPVVQC